MTRFERSASRTPAFRSLHLSTASALVLAVLTGCAPDADAPAENDAAGDAADATPAAAQAPVSEGPDIWLADLTWEDGRAALSGLRNATNRPGYDNQPFFFPDGSIFFTRQVGETTDIWRLDPATGVTLQVTTTEADGEYSATPLPDGSGFSVIRQEPDGTQLLVAHDMDGTSRGPIFDSVQPVGYHAWIDDRRVGMFILGNPATLQVATLGVDAAEIQAEDIGRSLHAMPGRPGAMSFPLRMEDGEYMISMWENGEVTPIVQSRPGAQDYAWGNGLIFQAEGSRLYTFDPADPDAGWTQVLDLTDAGVQITRLAVRADGGMIAIVGEITPAED